MDARGVDFDCVCLEIRRCMTPTKTRRGAIETSAMSYDRCMQCRITFGKRRVNHRSSAAKVCRYDWHSAGSLDWPFPVLKYKHNFPSKMYGSDFCQTALGNCYGLKLQKMLIAVKNKFIVSFIIIFGTLSFPVERRADRVVTIDQCVGYTSRRPRLLCNSSTASYAFCCCFLIIYFLTICLRPVISKTTRPPIFAKFSELVERWL